MKKQMLCMVLLCCFLAPLRAARGVDQRLSPEAFREKQREFITTHAGLTKEEAARFFPVYFELQDKKKLLHDDTWEIIRQAKGDNVSEARYAEINEQVADNRVAAARLDKTYLGKFKEILSQKKIYLVQRAEMRFHREMLKGMHPKEKGLREKHGPQEPGRK